VLVITDQGFVDVVVSEEFLGVARVFAGDLIYFFQDADGAQCDVFEISDRRSYQI